jgi:hypothetical protein
MEYSYLFAEINGGDTYFRKALVTKCRREFEAVFLYGGSRGEMLTGVDTANTVCTAAV